MFNRDRKILDRLICMRKILLGVFFFLVASSFLGLFPISLFLILEDLRAPKETKENISEQGLYPSPQKPENKPSFFLDLFEEKREELIARGADFLEVNLSEMEVKIYKKGEISKKLAILAKGNSLAWGGTASGLYEVGSKYKIAFSNISHVYMPWSIQIYGKYYIHGEPYYPGGKKLISRFSGGCIRLSDKDAKTVYEAAQKGMPLLVIDKAKDNYRYFAENPEPLFGISATSYLVADLDSGFVFSEKESDRLLPLTSLTKLMLALVAEENIALKRLIKVEPEMLQFSGNTEGLKAGEKFMVVELFHPLLMESSNDAAEILAGFRGRQKTIDLMNKKAKAILMENSKFSDPSGLDPENVSTAQDLFYLGRYILNNRLPFLQISKGKKISSFGEVKFDVEKFWNKNIFIHDPALLGGQVGSSKASKNNGLFIFRLTAPDDSKRDVIIVLLGSDSLESDGQRVYFWLMKSYFSKEIDQQKQLSEVRPPTAAKWVW